MSNKSVITQKRLKELVYYNEETGLFSRKMKKSHNAKCGYIGHGGYVRISVDNQQYYAHRLAWLYMYGDMPKEIDHIDNNPSNNSKNNLRSVSHKTNQRNMKLHKHSKSGVSGVFFDKKLNKWISYITVDGKRKHIGCFVQKQEAVNSRKEHEKKHGFL